MADVPLLKGKIGNISLDISVNNFSGIYKVVLIEYIENQLKNGFNRSNLFSKTPDWRNSNYHSSKELLEEFGYESNGRISRKL